MLLFLEHPELPSCADCQQWIYNPATWERERRGGIDQPRMPGTPLPCWKCPKIPKGVEPKPENAIELSAKNWECYDHYLRCKAVGRFPDDQLVERNAGLIRAAEDRYASRQQQMTHILLKAIAGVR